MLTVDQQNIKPKIAEDYIGILKNLLQTLFKQTIRMVRFCVYALRYQKHQFYSQRNIPSTNLRELPKERSWVFSHFQQRWEIEFLHDQQSAPQFFIHNKGAQTVFWENNKFQISSRKKKEKRWQIGKGALNNTRAIRAAHHTTNSARGKKLFLLRHARGKRRD